METKPALKTTEFWIHAALQIFFLLNTLEVWNYVPEKWSGAIQAAMGAAYVISRGQAKSGVPYGGATAVAVTTNPDADPAVYLDSETTT